MEQTFNPSGRLLELWGEMASRMAVAGMTANPQAPPPEAARQLRAAVFQAMSQFAEQYMRTPEFLGAMKQSFDATLQLREQANEMLTRIHHELQGVARKDVDSLLQSVHQGESRVMDRLDDIAGQLETINRRLDAIESARPAPAPKSQAGKNRRTNG